MHACISACPIPTVQGYGAFKQKKRNEAAQGGRFLTARKWLLPRKRMMVTMSTGKQPLLAANIHQVFISKGTLTKARPLENLHSP